MLKGACQSIKGERITLGITEVVIKAKDLRGGPNSGCRGSCISSWKFKFSEPLRLLSLQDSDGPLLPSHFMVKIQRDKMS